MSTEEDIPEVTVVIPAFALERGELSIAATAYLNLAIMQFCRSDALSVMTGQRFDVDNMNISGWGFPYELPWEPADDPDLNLRKAIALVQAELGEVDAGAFPDQTEIATWSAISYPALSDGEEVLGIVEEVGELARAVNKRSQGVRGNAEKWTAEIEKELGDIFIKTADVADRLGFTWAALARKRWATVSKRNDSIGSRPDDEETK